MGKAIIPAQQHVADDLNRSVLGLWILFIKLIDCQSTSGEFTY
jgi:hypothetical protein